MTPMQALSSAEVRERFLRFFEARAHTRHPSDSLVPSNDPTLLFTGAGMNQFKDMFLGQGSLPFKRATTSQKCIRVPDLENVGVTPRHHTFFEMLGNFSFGDYFKHECIAWEWEFFTKELGIPGEQLVVTVYKDDDEAFAIWRDDIGLPEERIFRFGEKENFWPAEAPSKGPNGPCGPCSELYFDASPAEPYPSKEGLEDLPEDRFTEIGNCVFTQFDRQDDGSLPPLPQKNIDVGLGLERIVAVLAGAPNNFETDLFEPYLRHLGEKSGTKYGDDAKADVRMRRISDHVRAITFCIVDGALPSNEGRGYVVRKILRRAARDGWELGIKGSFLFEMVDVVCEVMGSAYPELPEHADQTKALIKSEEESFAGVYRQGMARLVDFLNAATAGEGVLAGSGDFAFQLHDTFGFPVDISRQVLADRGWQLDEDGFETAMSAQRERARAASVTSDAVFAGTAAMALNEKGVPGTEFTGYTSLQGEATLLALLSAENKLVETAPVGSEVRIVVSATPFYAKGGGQVGDSGLLHGDGFRAEITATVKMDHYHLHTAKVLEGELKQGSSCVLEVDAAARQATERNHTATHLMHAALKKVLGSHVGQAGSEVSPERLRFDYTHGERLSPAQITEIEDEVNREIMRATPVEAVIRDLEAARAAGFVAMFGEKYGAEVRTLAVGDYSLELCGGTHVANSGNIGAFRVVSEGAVSAGTRRIEGVTGQTAIDAARAERQALSLIAGNLKVQPLEVPERVQALVQEAKKLRKDLEKALATDLGQVYRELEAALVTSGSVKTAVFETKGLNMKELQDLMTRAKQALSPFAGAFFVSSEQGVLVGALVSPELTKTIRAGDLVKELCGVLGGGGGGRPEMAQGKGQDLSKLPEAKELALQKLAGVGI